MGARDVQAGQLLLLLLLVVSVAVPPEPPCDGVHHVPLGLIHDASLEPLEVGGESDGGCARDFPFGLVFIFLSKVLGAPPPRIKSPSKKLINNTILVY